MGLSAENENNYSTFINYNTKSKRRYSSASWFSKLFFVWVFDLLYVGRTKKLQQQDLWELEEKFTSKISYSKLSMNNPFKGLGKALIRTFGSKVCLTSLLYLGALFSEYLGPVVLSRFVTLMSKEQLNTSEINFCLFVLIVSRLAKDFCYQHFYFEMHKCAIQARSSLKALVYEKSLKLCSASIQEKHTGSIANIYTTDVQNILKLFILLPALILLPLLILGVVCTLYTILSHATVACCVLILVLILVQRQLSALSNRFYSSAMSAKDKRMNVISEVFDAIRIIKLNSWEKQFSSRILDARAIELHDLRKFCYIVAAMIFCAWGSPVFISAATFVFYTVVLKNTLTSATAFTALAFFRMLQFQIAYFSKSIPRLTQASISLNRLQEFIGLEEYDPESIKGPNSISEQYRCKDPMIVIENGSFSWSSKPLHKSLITNLNLHVKKGEFVVIYGPVGSGKTSLCSAFLGEMKKVEGRTHIGGSLSYCSQEPWIQNLTIRENITFGSPWNPSRYNEVLRCCSLDEDLKALTGGDMTEIGQKGINLSGGQKARLSLARACYNDADIYIFDSSLSAVDSIVRNYIFKECLTKFLRNKTIILITHHIDIIHSDLFHRSIELFNGQVVSDTTNSGLKMTSKIRSSIAEQRLIDCRIQSENDLKMVNQGRYVEEEHREEGRVSTRVFKSYFDGVGGISTILLILCMQAMCQILLISSDFWLSHWTNAEDKMANTSFYLGIYCCFSFSSISFLFIRAISLTYFGIKGSQTMFIRMTESLLHAPVSFFDSNPVGRLLNRYSKDIDTLDTTIYFSFGACLSMGFSFLGVLIATLYAVRSVWMTLTLPLMGIFYCCSNLSLQSSRDLQRLVKVAESPLLSHVSESINGVIVIRAFGQSSRQRFVSKHNDLIDQYSTAKFSQISVSQWFALYQQLITAAMIFLIGTSLVFLHGSVSSGTVGLICSYGLQLDDSLYDVFMSWCTLENSMVSPERIDEYINARTEASHIIESTDPGNCWPSMAQVTFQNVSFRYRENGKLILHDISFSTLPNEKVGIVGRTGAGKSSLAMALFRIHELSCGRIFIDDVDISTLGLHTLRTKICIVTQDPSLFVGTIRTSLDPFRKFNDDDLWEVVRKVGLIDKVNSMQGKLEASLNTNASNLSMGERQLFCLCRALLKKAKLIVLDEASASVDYETDRKIQDLIKCEFENSTVLTIAHRLDSVMGCNRIMVLQHGKIDEFDTPTNLLKRQGLFYKMAQEGGYLTPKMCKDDITTSKE